MSFATELTIRLPSPVLFLFGLSGAGKNYVGDIIAARMNWAIYHADDDITPAMRQALSDKQPFTEQMRDDYFPIVVSKIRELSCRHSPLVVTQAVYKRRHREFLLLHLPMLTFLWVDAADEVILRRLAEREEGIAPESALALRRDFEPPAATAFRLINDGNEQGIISQLNQLFPHKVLHKTY